MTLEKITMDHDDARARYEAYLAMPEAKRTPEDVAAMRGFKALADGKELLDLDKAMADAGVGADRMPRLAIARADQASVRFSPNRLAGGGEFTTDGRAYRGRGAAIRTVIPSGTFESKALADWGDAHRLRAHLPTIPPEHRPAPEHLKHYHVLWEAVWKPQPPVDPFLLRHLAGSLYVVLAQWDLTPLEQAVLRGRIQREEEGR